MLTIIVPATTSFDEANNEFIESDEFVLELEHSLVSLSKWEAIFEKPFLNSENKTDKETLAYIEAMTLTPNVPDIVFKSLTNDNVEKINAYLGSKQSATWFAEKKNVGPEKREIITAEVIYYWLIALTIPMECETWNLNRLFTLIKVCNEKNAPPEKNKRVTKSDLARRKAMNEQRRAQMKSSG